MKLSMQVGYAGGFAESLDAHRLVDHRVGPPPGVLVVAQVQHLEALAQLLAFLGADAKHHLRILEDQVIDIGLGDREFSTMRAARL